MAAAGPAGCGPARFTVGTSPFPADTPVFLDESGTPRSDLPRDPEPTRLLFLDFPWCPPCDGMWEEIRSAASQAPSGSLKIYRILFDRERLFPGREPVEVPPRVPIPPRTPFPVDSAGREIPVATWTAIPGAFRDRFRVSRVPVLLLLDDAGAVTARWTGTSPGLAASLGEAIRKPPATAPSAER
ncbi:MAG: hypothetical protein Kow00128_14200 [Deltaproteobacteria bacterium]